MILFKDDCITFTQYLNEKSILWSHLGASILATYFYYLESHGEAPRYLGYFKKLYLYKMVIANLSVQRA